MFKSYVQYGDLLVLQHFTDQQNQYKHGFVSATGFIQKELYLFQSKNFCSYMDEVAQIPLNYRTFVFQITPKLNFDYHRDYQKLLQKYIHLKKKNQVTKFLKKKLEKMSKKMAEENQINIKKIKKMKKKNVYYGDNIQLMHFDSKSYVSGVNDYEHNDMIGYNCKLVDGFAESMVFQVLPKFKTHQIGDNINYDDTVYLRNVIYNAYFNFREEYEEYEYFHKPISELVPLHNWVDSQYEKKKIFLSQEKDCNFTIKLFQKNFKSSNFISFFDYIMLEHTELSALLTADNNYQFKNNQEQLCYLRKYTGTLEQEFFNLNSIWIIEQYQNNAISERVQAANSLNKSNNIQNYVLRHFSTGKFLSFVKIDNETCLRLDQDIKNSNIEFQPLENNEYLVNKNLYYITEKNENQYLKACTNNMTDFDFETQSKDNTEIYQKQRNIKLFPLKDSDLEIKKFGIILNNEENQENVFKIKKVSEDLIQKILFVKSGVQKMRLFLDKFKDKQNLKDWDLMNAIQILQIIIKFIFNIDESQIVNYYQIQFEPIQQNQKLLRDIYFIDILIEIFYLSFNSYNIQNYDSNQNNSTYNESNDLLLNFIKMSFSAMRYTIGEYRPNELYASQWLQFLMKNTLETKEKSDTLIGLTLTELIDNNTKILETRIKTSTIKLIIEGMKFDTTNLYFIDLLKAICICNEKPMFFNQKITTSLLLNETSYRDRGFKFFMKGNTIKVKNQMISYDINNKPIEKVYSKDLQLLNPHEKKYQYILNFCQLIADLCMNRNYSAIKFAQQQFPKEVLLQIIKNDDYNYEIREVVLNMLINIWMDREPYQFQNKPRLLVLLNKSFKKDIDQQEQEERFDSIFTDINYFLWDFLNDLKPNNDLSKINFQIIVVDTLIKLIHIQYINKKEEFQKLLRILLKILDYFVKDKQDQKHVLVGTRKMKNQDCLDLDNLQKRKDAFYVKIFELIKVVLKFSIASSYEEFIKDYFEKFQGPEKKFYKLDVAKLGKKVVKTLKKKVEKLSTEEQEINKFRDFYINSIKDKKIHILDYKILNSLVYYPLKFFVKSQNKDILMSSLTLISELYYQNKKFISFFKKISFVYDEDHYQLYKLLQKNSMILFQKLEQIENWYDLNYVKSIEQIIKNLNIFLQQKKDVVFQIQLTSYTKQLLEYQLLQEDIDFEFIQKLFDNLNIIPNIFKILFYDNHYHKEIKNKQNPKNQINIQLSKQNSDSVELQDTIIRILNEIYQMMYFYQKDNTQTTKIICKYYIETINKHFKRKVFYSIILLQDLLKDNKNIIFNEQRSEKIISNVLKSLQNQDQDPVLLIQSLKIINAFLDYKGYKIKKHQAFFTFKLLKNQYFTNIKKFLKEILIQSDNQRYYIQIYIEKNQDKVFIKQNIEKEHDYLGDVQAALLLKENINLFLAMMETIFICINRNHFVTNLCLGILDLNGFLQVYKYVTFENGLPLKVVILKYLKLVILENKEQNQSLNENLILLWKELKQDYEQIEFFLQNEQKNFQTLVITHNKLTTIKDIFTSYFNYFIDCVNIIVSTLKQQNDQNNFNDILSVKNTLKNFGKQINVTLQELDINTKKHEELLTKIQNLVIHQRRKSSLIKQRNNTQYTIQLNQKRSSLKIDIFDRQNRFYQRKSTQLQQKLKMDSLFNKFQRSDSFLQIQADEYNCLIGFLEGLDEIKNKGSDFRLKQFIDNLILFTMQEEKKNENIVLIATKLLRNILEIDSGYHGDFVLSELNEDKILNVNDIFNKQNNFADLGIAKFVCNLLKEKDFNLKTKKQLLLMANNYLYGGNKKIQLLFIEYFQSDIKNDRIEIFSVLSILLESCFQKVKKRIQRRNKEKLNNFYRLKKDSQGQCDNIEDIKSKVEDFNTNYEICRLIYRFFQLLCEGHNTKIQNFLRTQFDSEEYTNINIIEIAVSHWGTLIKFLNADCAQLGVNMLEFLIESIEGPCYKNQQEVYNKKIVEYSKDFMRDFSDVKDCQIRGFTKENDNFSFINDLIALNIKLLNTLIEANDDLEVYKKMGQKINFDLLMDKLCDYYEEFREENTKYYKNGIFQRLDKNAFKGKISEAFNIMIFIRNIDYKTHIYSSCISKLNIYQTEVYNFFFKNTAKIEIIFKEKIYMIFFTIQPACHLSMSVKKNFLSEISIETPFDKLNGIIQNSAVLFEQMDHLNSLQNINKKLTPDLFNTVGNYSYCVILLINVIMVLFLRAEIQNNKVTIQFVSSFYRDLIDYLGLVNLGLNVVQLILWFILEFNIYISKNFNKQLSKLKKKIQNYKEPTNEISTAQKILQNSFLYQTFKDKLFILKLSAKLDGFDNTIPLLEYFFSITTFMCENYQFLFLVFLILLNIFAYLKKFYIFYCFPLFNIIVSQKDSLQNFIKCNKIDYLSWKTTSFNIYSYNNIYIYICNNRLPLY